MGSGLTILAVGLPGRLAVLVAAPLSILVAVVFLVRLLRNEMRFRVTMYEVMANFHAAGRVLDGAIREAGERTARVEEQAGRLDAAVRDVQESGRQLGTIGEVIREDRRNLANALLEALLGEPTPATTPEPASSPEPDAAPESEDLAVDREPAPAPDTAPASHPEPEPEPEPEPSPGADARPEPTPSPTSDQQPAAAPHADDSLPAEPPREPEYEPEPEYEVEPEPEPEYEFAEPSASAGPPGTAAAPTAAPSHLPDSSGPATVDTGGTGPFTYVTRLRVGRLSDERTDHG